MNPFGLLFVAAACTGGGLAFERTSIDLGKVRAAGTLQATFPFRVGSGADATIVDLRPGCGCLRPSLAKKSYRAGETGRIVLDMHASSQTAGRKRFTLSVDLRDPVERTIELVVDAELDADLSIQPSNLLIYMSGDDPLRQSIVLSDRRGKPPTILQAVSSASWIRVRTPSLSGSDEGTIRRLELTVLPTAEGKHSETIELTTADPGNPRLEIPITVIRQGRLRCTPTSLRLRRPTQTGATTRGMLLLTDSRGGPLRIESASSDAPQVDLRWSKEKQTRARVDVLVGAAENSTGSFEAAVRTVEPVAAEFKIQLTIE